MHDSCRNLISGDVCGTSPSAQHTLRLATTVLCRRLPHTLRAARGTWHGAPRACPRVAHKNHRGLARKEKVPARKIKKCMASLWLMAKSSCLAFRHHGTLGSRCRLSAFGFRNRCRKTNNRRPGKEDFCFTRLRSGKELPDCA